MYRPRVSAQLPIAAVSALAVAVAAPSFAAAQEAAELPEVEVITSATPVKKPKRSRPQPAPASSSSFSDPELEPEPLPAQIETTADDSFFPVTVVPEGELLAQPGSTITDALQYKPGIAGSTFAAGANRPVIRGLDTYRVRIQENGIGTHDASALSEDHAFTIDPYAADRVEVIRGPATLRYGSQAIGGVVAVENGRIPTIIPPGGFSGSLSGGISSVDDGSDGAFKATAGANGFAFHADGFKRRAEDYDTPDGTQLNTFVESEGGALGASLIGSAGFFGISFSRFETLYGIPGEEAAEEAPRIDMVQDRFQAKGEWNVRSSAIEAVRFWFGASDYEHVELANEDGETHIGSRYTNKEQEARIEVQHRTFSLSAGELSGAIGAQWGHRDLRADSFEGDGLLAPAETDTIAGFIFEELQVNPALRLQAAARLEHTKVDGAGIEEPFAANPVVTPQEATFNAFSASLGGLYNLPSGIVARLNGQYVERAPDAAELFSKGVHEATGTFEIGNPNLDIEAASTVEFGLKRNIGKVRFGASVYHTWYDGFIFKQLTGEECGETLDSCGTEDELQQILFTQRDARFYGLELAGAIDIGHIGRGIWGIDGQYDFVRAKFTNGEDVPRIPPHRLGGGLFYRDANWFARAGVLHAFDQDDIGVNETETGSYTLVSAEVSYTAELAPNAFGAPEFTIGLKGENLADDKVRNHASFTKDEVLQPGANVRLFGTLKLN